VARTAELRAVLAASALLASAPGCDQKVIHDIDDTPPEATIASPADGSDVSGVTFRLEITATDDTGVDHVRFRVNNGAPVTDTAAPWELTVITLTDAESTDLPVEVDVLDAAGNETKLSAQYTVAARTITRLTDQPNDDMNPAWSPDGARIAFQAKRNGDQFDLWTMNADGSNQAELTANVNEDRNPAWSPDGEWIAFDTDRMGTFDIWLLPLSGGEAGASAVTFGNNDDVEPAWTPGGVDLYFASDRGAGTPFNIWRVPAVGTDADAVQITAFDVDDSSPAVSPDGTLLAFTSQLNFATPHAYTTEIGSGDVTPVTGGTGVAEADPAWVPSGALIFSRDDGVDSNLWLQRTTGTNPEQVSFGSGTVGDGGAALSPDGSKLAFHSDRDGNLEIYVME
jgi:TolB protein